MTKPGSFEVRSKRLFLNGEALSVRRRVVQSVLSRARPSGEGPLPEPIARAMIALERELSLLELAACLTEASRSGARPAEMDARGSISVGTDSREAA